MRVDPRREILESIRGRHLELQWLAELALPAGSLEVHDHLARDGERGLGSVILFDEREREIDTRGHSGGRIELSRLEKNGVRVQLEFWKALCQIVSETPMCGDGSAVEEPAWRQAIDAG